MSEIYLWLKWAHVVSSTVLFGMGAGIAFSNRSGSRCITADKVFRALSSRHRRQILHLRLVYFRPFRSKLSVRES